LINIDKKITLAITKSLPKELHSRPAEHDILSKVSFSPQVPRANLAKISGLFGTFGECQLMA
jgi:hypothetical protein